MEGSQGGNSREELKKDLEKLSLRALPQAPVPLPSYITQIHLPGDGTALSELGLLPPLAIKKKSPRIRLWGNLVVAFFQL